MSQAYDSNAPKSGLISVIMGSIAWRMLVDEHKLVTLRDLKGPAPCRPAIIQLISFDGRLVFRDSLLTVQGMTCAVLGFVSC